MAESEYRIDGNKWLADFNIGTAEIDGGEGATPWSKVAIRSMNIEENIFEPFSRGTVTLIDPENLLEDGFLTRGDGDDTVTLKFRPEDSSPGEVQADFKLVINGESNSVSRSDRLNNLKTYELLDANYFKLNEPIPYGERFRGLIGDIILRIFKKFEIPVDEAGWEPGAHEIDIFPEHILPPISFRYSDLVKYLIRINYNEAGEGSGGSASGTSKTYVRSLLYWDRNNMNYVFKSLETIYKKPTCHESFVAGEFPDGQPNANNTGEKGPVYYISQLHSTGLTTPMLTYSNAYFMNFLVSGYDPQLGEHGLREIRIEDVKKKWADVLKIEDFPVLGGKAKPFMPLNPAKKHELFRTFSLPFSLDKVAKLAEAEMIGNMTFYNMELTLHQLGDVTRRVGMFVDVENLAKASNTDAKLCGRWLVTKCTHEFINNSYYNTLFCTKIYTGPGAEENSRVENINSDG